MKKAFSISLLWLIPVFFLNAQQITRFAVVDLARVYSAFQSDTKAMRDWEDKSIRVQQEVDKRTAEIQNLKTKHAEAVLNDNGHETARLETEIHRKTEALRTYFETETRKLEDQKTRLSEGPDFLNRVYNSLRVVAESEGYSMVLNLRENKGIAWYSQAIDITDKVIANLRSRSAQ